MFCVAEFVVWLKKTFPDIDKHVDFMGRPIHEGTMNIAKFCGYPKYISPFIDDAGKTINSLYKYMDENKIQYDLWKL